MDPERRHHRYVCLLLRGLLLVDRTLAVRVTGGDGEPASRLREHCQDTILASQLFRGRMVLYNCLLTVIMGLTFVLQHAEKVRLFFVIVFG